MRIFDKFKLYDEELGAEGPADAGAGEANEAPDTDPNSENFDFDAWMAEDENNEEVEAEAEAEEEEVEEEEAPAEEAKEEEEAETEEKPEEAEKYELTVNGEKVEYDPSNKDENIKWIQMGMSAHQKWKEAADMQKQSNQFIQALKSNPRDILENPALGIDMVSLAEEVLYERLEEEGLSDREKALRKENRELKSAKHKEMLEQQKREQQARQEQENQRVENIKSALDKAGLPTSIDVVNHTLNYMQNAIDAGTPNVSPELVLDYVRKDYNDAQREHFSKFTVEQLTDLLGKDMIEKIREHNVKAALETRKKAPPKKVVSKKSKKEEADQRHIGDLSSWLNR